MFWRMWVQARSINRKEKDFYVLGTGIRKKVTTYIKGLQVSIGPNQKIRHPPATVRRMPRKRCEAVLSRSEVYCARSLTQHGFLKAEGHDTLSCFVSTMSIEMGDHVKGGFLRSLQVNCGLKAEAGEIEVSC